MLTSIMPFISWLNPKRIAILIASIILAWFLYQATVFVNRALDDREKVILLTVENDALRENERINDILIENQRESIKRAEEALEKEQERAEEFEQALDAVNNALPEDDAISAPVLEDALDFLRNR